MIRELECIYNSQKSFHGKAEVGNSAGGEVLYSYDRIVCKTKGKKYYLYGAKNNMEDSPFTKNTKKHVKEFLKQKGIKADKWEQICKDAAGISCCGRWYGENPDRSFYDLCHTEACHG